MLSRKLLVIAFATLSQVAFAQLDLGAKIGVNLTKIDGSAFSDQFKYGYHAGGFIAIPLGKKFGFQPEVLYNQNSLRVDTSFTNTVNGIFRGGITSVKLNYLSIPILINYKLVGKFITLQLGPQFGILLDQNRTFLQNGGNAFKSGDLSLLGGVQVKLGPLRVNGRYVIGLNNLSDLTNNSQWKSRGYQVSAGIAIL
ncbi:MAG: PorT family protein [Bacteroidetes bacterium]|nr:PorT family protein [Bacteroidota bacterium]